MCVTRLPMCSADISVLSPLLHCPTQVSRTKLYRLKNLLPLRSFPLLTSPFTAHDLQTDIHKHLIQTHTFKSRFHPSKKTRDISFWAWFASLSTTLSSSIHSPVDAWQELEPSFSHNSAEDRLASEFGGYGDGIVIIFSAPWIPDSLTRRQMRVDFSFSTLRPLRLPSGGSWNKLKLV